MTGLLKVKEEDHPMQCSNPLRKACKPIEGMQSFRCTSSQDIPTPKASVGLEGMPSSRCTPTSDHPSPTIPTPKASPNSKEMPLGCTPTFLNALQLFWVDIERIVNVSIKNLEEHKSKLKIILDHHRHDVEVATTTMKEFLLELQRAETVLSQADTDDNRGELKYMQFAIKSAENKVNLKKAQYNEVLLQWHHQKKVVAEKSQAQKVLETHFRFKAEEAQPFGL